MADQPTNVPADNDAGGSQPSSQPVNNVADNTVAQSQSTQAPQQNVPSGIDEGVSKYLSSQGISIEGKSEDEVASYIKLANNAISAKKASSDEANKRKQLEDQLKQSLGIPGVQPQNIFPELNKANNGVVVNSSNTSQVVTPDNHVVTQPTQSSQTPQLTNANAALLQQTVAAYYPQLRDQVFDNSLFTEYVASGGSLLDPSGDINVAGVSAYAASKVKDIKLAELEKENQDLKKSQLSSAPSVDVTQHILPAESPMTEDAANVIIFDPNHPRHEEAKKFLASMT